MRVLKLLLQSWQSCFAFPFVGLQLVSPPSLKKGNDMASQFSKCPTWWIRNGILKSGFKGGNKTGESIAGLKCIIAISHSANFYSMEAELSYSALEKLTGLSRPMVSKGIDLIQRLGLIEIEKGYRNKYKLISENGYDVYWAKLPLNYLRKELPKIYNRGRVTLFALKFYFQLLSDRPNGSVVMHMTYDTINIKVGTQPRDIKPAIDLLFNHNLISVAKAEAEDMRGKKEYKKNEYTIRGLEQTIHQT